MNSYSGKHILILGMGKSGLALQNFLLKHDAQISIYDDRYCENNTSVYHNINQINFDKIDLIAVSPGIAPNHPVLQKAKQHSILVMGEIEIGLKATTNTCIGITGTNGKSTVTTLVTHIFNQAGHKARAVGNIGVPITSIVDSLCSDEILVVELSSYQLDQLHSAYLDLGLILNITADHLDRYHTFLAYAHSKLSLQKLVKNPRNLFVSKRIWDSYSKNFKVTPTVFDRNKEEIITLLGSKLNGFVPENIFAACSIAKHFNISFDLVEKSLKNFQGLPHRCEFVQAFNGVKFYNDSKATNPESVFTSLLSFQQPVHLIMGGEDKNLDYSILEDLFSQKVKGIYVVGEIKEKIAQYFKKKYPVIMCSSLENAVKKAYNKSLQGEVVLLSPGTSSFDMFKNFEHRGNEFKRLICQLEGEKI